MGVIINNQNTKTLGFALVGRPTIPSAVKRYESTDVEGRDGSLTRFLGYEDLKFSLNFNILFQSDIKQKLREIKGVLAQAGTLSFDDSPNFYYKIKQAQISETESVIKASGVFSVEFIAEPYEYQKSTLTAYTTKPISLTNQTTTESLPIIKVTGTGTVVLTVNGTSITLTGLTSSITLDSELQEAYTGLTTNMNSNMNGNFPVLKIGSNTISWTGTVTKVEIDPKWRWLT
ncbi:phage tail domain-containing protein [Lactococcus raffinolactis]|uniref:phage tail domain-containing protein n=1 Tax=Pseudolactococcus raffinolactis TaxID=1366 RepID=UPI001436AA57|nr:phage tail domain-containing protein [Lactococcus raffinolactis]QIW50794.1 phage tail protein [Lactococcus raffinolactis]